MTLFFEPGLGSTPLTRRGWEDGPRSWNEPGCGSTPLAKHRWEDGPRSWNEPGCGSTPLAKLDGRIDQDFNSCPMKRIQIAKVVSSHTPTS